MTLLVLRVCPGCDGRLPQPAARGARAAEHRPSSWPVELWQWQLGPCSWQLLLSSLLLLPPGELLLPKLWQLLKFADGGLQTESWFCCAIRRKKPLHMLVRGVAGSAASSWRRALAMSCTQSLSTEAPFAPYRPCKMLLASTPKSAPPDSTGVPPTDDNPVPTDGLDTMPSWDCVKFEDCVRALHRIRSGVVKTECRRSHWLSSATDTELYLKSEHHQFTGSFKERGARNALLSLSVEERTHGVVAASAGNHALAMAWHGAELGIPVTVVMPTLAPMAKVDKCRHFGANVVIHGSHIGEAKQYAMDTYAHQRCAPPRALL